MNYATLLIEMDDSMATAMVTLNRPGKLNALNDEMIAELGAALEELEQDPSVRVVIVTGAGEKAFAAGADIEELSTLNALQAVAKSERGQVLMFHMGTISKPVIMAINGFALGAGCELAMAGDIRIASDRAKFGQPEINIGIIPGYGGTQRLPRLVGKGLALDLLLSGRTIDAQEALRIGLVDRVVSHEKLLAEVKSLAGEIAAKAPIAVGLIKKCVYVGMETDAKSGCSFESLQFGAACTTEDQKEGARAFLEKRKPVFQGK